MSFWKIIIALLVFSLIIIIHEFGHFIVAKHNKVGVIEFSLGMGPRIISWGKTEKGYKVLFFKTTKWLEANPIFGDNTLYSWKLLPFGGSCMMLGEDDMSVEDDRAFGKKSVYARMAIIFAGPFFNFILAFVLALFVIGIVGYDPAVISKVDVGSPAAEAGMQAGDVVRKVNDKSIVIDRDLSYYLLFHPFSGQEVTVTIERDGQEKVLTMVPEQKTVKDKKGQESAKYLCGFNHGTVKRQRVGVWDTIKYSAYEVKFWIGTTIESLGHMIKGKVSMDDISGPVGIVKTMGDSMTASAKNSKEGEAAKNVTLTLMNIAILLTANLGVMNLIPIPALDGGRLLFLIIEWIRRKPLPQKFEAYVNAVGFILLMAFMVFIMGNDILNLIPKK
ncbi:MAG: site-2 protease family protein [Eubacterium sp.]|nr:site-2 protease family protein [Eubacterium sp.]